MEKLSLSKFSTLTFILFLVLESASSHDETPSICPFGSPQAYCIVRPCKFATCPRFPHAECRDNYCDGCKAEFWLGGTKLTKAQCRRGSCHDGSHPGTCIVRPCQYATCPRFPSAECRDNYCDGCKAEFWLGGTKLTKAQCRRGSCPDGTNPVNCLIAPCENAKCPRFPAAQCRDNYCGGCNAEFYLHGRKLSDHECRDVNPLPSCRNTFSARHIQPICHQKCGHHYGCAHDEECCSNGYCNTCQKKFTDDIRCPPNTGFGTCIHQCETSADCGYDKICCSNGCGRVCKKLSTFPKCKTYHGPSSLALHSCPDRCGKNWQCGYGETCCYNGFCHVCQKKPGPHLPKCKASYYGGAASSGSSTLFHCKKSCRNDHGCGRLERCCNNGLCNKCELRSGVGGGYPKCKASAATARLSVSLCTDDCGPNRPPCQSHHHCCFNGFCRKCELNVGGGGGHGIEKCSSSYGLTSMIYCQNECSTPNGCGYGYKCCFNGWCNRCVKENIFFMAG